MNKIRGNADRYVLAELYRNGWGEYVHTSEAESLTPGAVLSLHSARLVDQHNGMMDFWGSDHAVCGFSVPVRGAVRDGSQYLLASAAQVRTCFWCSEIRYKVALSTIGLRSQRVIKIRGDFLVERQLLP